MLRVLLEEKGDLKVTLQATLTTNLTREAMSVVEKPNTF